MSQQVAESVLDRMSALGQALEATRQTIAENGPDDPEQIRDLRTAAALLVKYVTREIVQEDGLFHVDKFRTADACERALSVLMLDANCARLLSERDPQATRQACQALLRTKMLSDVQRSSVEITLSRAIGRMVGHGMTMFCKVPDCGNVSFSDGYCGAHLKASLRSKKG